MNRETMYSPEVRERAIRLVLEQQGEQASQWAAIGSIASKVDCTAETLRKWVRQAERDQGLRGVRRGKSRKTTIPDTGAWRPADRVNRHIYPGGFISLSVRAFLYRAHFEVI